MSPHLLDLPTEILEYILTLLCHETARFLQAIRQSCRTLHTIIAHSKLLTYLERIALQGTYDPTAFASASEKTLALPERVASLRTWEESWGALEGTFWKERAPDLFIARPPMQWSGLPSLESSLVRMRYLSATIVDPDPEAPRQMEEHGQHGDVDESDHFSFGPWFVSATRDGISVRASYSYLDLHGCLGGAEGAPLGGGGQSGENGDHYDSDRVCWTVIKVPVWNVMSFALSTELDLAVVISCVVIHSQFFVLFIVGNTAEPKLDTRIRGRGT
jgi:hypothetical protein